MFVERRGLSIDVPEPLCEQGERHAGLVRMHRSGVPDHVWVDPAGTSPSPCADNVRQGKMPRVRTELFRQAIVDGSRQHRSRASDAQERANIGIT